MEQTRAFISMYCKIGCDDFPSDFIDGQDASGDQVYQFLIQDVGYAIDLETEESIPGAAAIWYLGCNEKGGCVGIDEMISEWSFGESNWDRVLAFLHLLNEKCIITVPQYVHLISLVEEGMRNFDDMYDIPDYLKAKINGTPWQKRKTDTKENMKRMIGSVVNAFQNEGYEIQIPFTSKEHAHPQ